MSFELATNIKIVNPSSNIDELYGPYNDFAEAYINIPLGLRKEGKTFGIIESGEVKEYWWNSESSLGNGEEVVKSNTTEAITEILVDESLYLDPVTGELRINVGEAKQTFVWASGNPQEFTLLYTPVIISYIAVNGILLIDEIGQWAIDVENKKTTILDLLDDNDVITVNYKFIITETL